MAEAEQWAIDHPAKAVVIRCTNYLGETAERRVFPRHVWFGATAWHPEPQWLLEAWDPDRKAWRSFAMKDIASWRPA